MTEFFISLLSFVIGAVCTKVLDHFIIKYKKQETRQKLLTGEYIKCPFCNKNNMHLMPDGKHVACSCSHGFSYSLDSVLRNL